MTSPLGIFVDRRTLSRAPQLDALIRCRDVAERMGHNVEFIFPVDMAKIHKMGAVFIRTMTNPLNITYVVAKMAEFYSIPVIDDSQSIQICDDKVNMYLHLMKKKVTIPRTEFLSKTDLTPDRIAQLFDEYGSPVILKEPSTSFSMRVEKAHNYDEVMRTAKRFIKMSDWIVVQQYIESKYDWRIGVLNGEVIYGCKYLIPSETFKIQAVINGKLVYCTVESIPINKIPPKVAALGIAAANAVGRGLYGIDIKDTNKNPVVIEVNNNPSIEKWEDNGEPYVFEKIVGHLFRH
jgi:glutathione synthase/RimK-type ligase-like ATP-grasp enzyme